MAQHRTSKIWNCADTPTNYWLAHRNCYPVLSALARRYLLAPPTSIPSEQVFSTAGDILTDSRNRPSPDNAEKLLIMKGNLLKLTSCIKFVCLISRVILPCSTLTLKEMKVICCNCDFVYGLTVLQLQLKSYPAQSGWARF